jgi:hypothetical protein
MGPAMSTGSRTITNMSGTRQSRLTSRLARRSLLSRRRVV